MVSHIVRLYGWTENNREVEMDMREMVDKVKKGEPLYGHSSLTPYMQGVAARNSRYSALMAQVLPGYKSAAEKGASERWGCDSQNQMSSWGAG